MRGLHLTVLYMIKLTIVVKCIIIINEVNVNSYFINNFSNVRAQIVAAFLQQVVILALIFFGITTN